MIRLLMNKKIDRIPSSTGRGYAAAHGMENDNIRVPEGFADAGKMAGLAASTFEILSFESTEAHLDRWVEAEALGLEVTFYPYKEDRIVYPTIKRRPDLMSN
jgi:uroporphyrinogen-III decarboxylase